VYVRDPDGRLSLMAGHWPGAPERLPDDWPWPPAADAGGRAGGPDVPSGEGPARPEHLVHAVGRDQQVRGVLALGPRLSEEPYSREDADLLAVVANQVALALENLSLA
jgi:hypothetical protein